MKICHYTSLNCNNPVGGVERHILNISQALKELGHDCTVLPYNSKDLDAFDVIHTHGDFFPVNLLKRKFLTTKKIAWIQIAHGTTFGRMLQCKERPGPSHLRGITVELSCVSGADHVIAVGTLAQKELKKLYLLPENKTTAIANGVDPSVFCPLSAGAASRSLLFVGRAQDKVKNTKRLLNALNIVKKDIPELSLKAAPGIESDISIVKNIGPLSQEMLAKEFEDNAAVILPSLYEGDPLIIREAMASGIAVLLSDIPQLREAASNYEGAYFFNPRDENSIANAICSFFKNGALWQSRFKPKVRPWAQVAAEYLNVYKNLKF